MFVLPAKNRAWDALMNEYWSALKDWSATVSIEKYTVAQLAALTPTPAKFTEVWVTDAHDATDCTVGGGDGTHATKCVYNGFAWVVEFGW